MVGKQLKELSNTDYTNKPCAKSKHCTKCIESGREEIELLIVYC